MQCNLLDDIFNYSVKIAKCYLKDTYIWRWRRQIELFILSSGRAKIFCHSCMLVFKPPHGLPLPPASAFQPYAGKTAVELAEPSCGLNAQPRLDANRSASKSTMLAFVFLSSQDSFCRYTRRTSCVHARFGVFSTTGTAHFSS